MSPCQQDLGAVYPGGSVGEPKRKEEAQREVGAHVEDSRPFDRRARPAKAERHELILR